MQKQYRNGFLGWLFDAFLIEVIIAPLRVKIEYTPDLINLLVLFVMLGMFVVSILYHVRWKHKTQWISPGEHLIGTKLVDRKKVQTNPYPISRSVLFVIVVLNLLYSANIYDGSRAVFGYNTMSVLTLFNLCYNALLLGGALLLGMARQLGLYLIITAYGLILSAYFVTISKGPHEIAQAYLKHYIFLLAANILVGGYYLYRAAKQKPLQDSTPSVT